MKVEEVTMKNKVAEKQTMDHLEVAAEEFTKG